MARQRMGSHSKVGGCCGEKVVETGRSFEFEVKHVPLLVCLSCTSPALHTLAMSQVPQRLRDSSIRRRGAFGVLTGCNVIVSIRLSFVLLLSSSQALIPNLPRSCTSPFRSLNSRYGRETTYHDILSPKQLLPLRRQLHFIHSRLPPLVVPSHSLVTRQRPSNYLMTETNTYHAHTRVCKCFAGEVGKFDDPGRGIKGIVF